MRAAPPSLLSNTQGARLVRNLRRNSRSLKVAALDRKPHNPSEISLSTNTMNTDTNWKATTAEGETVRGFRVIIANSRHTVTLPPKDKPLLTGHQAREVMDFYAALGFSVTALTRDEYIGQDSLGVKDMHDIFPLEES